MFSLRDNIIRNTYITLFSIFLLILTLIFSNYFENPLILPNFALIAIIYFALYFNIFNGFIASYLFFYVYGCFTALNPYAYAMAGVIIFTAAFYLWKKFLADNIIYEIFITFISSIFYYFLIFVISAIYFKFKYNLFYYILFYLLPISIITSAMSPIVFYFFRKIDYFRYKHQKTGLKV
ncbi:MAG: hypothetical protein M1407_01990 [Deltaproteobacteria bacterium]|nr:hypothetical protein [Deltaproteobacteria bacterium]